MVQAELWIITAFAPKPSQQQAFHSRAQVCRDLRSIKMAQGSCLCGNIKYEYSGEPAMKVSKKGAFNAQFCIAAGSS
jgi:hypothetical protein